ncbi:MAG: hypothetical protein LBJ31_10695 [Treponema sp.]|jgi:hypothetical protein|nr:hypothetical protein [Treponema sp.]
MEILQKQVYSTDIEANGFTAMKKEGTKNPPRFLLCKKFSTICAVLFMTAALNTCKNPYIVHNLKRPVLMEAMAFRTDKDEPSAPAYPLRPVFNPQIREYTVVVHELAEKVYPTGYPEEGASVEYLNSRYMLNGAEVSAAQEGGGYAFPGTVSEMVIDFTVVKEYRIDSGYSVKVIRKPAPGRINNLSLTAAYWEGSGPLNTSPDAPSWIYENANYIKSFDALGLDYRVSVPFYAQKLLITPSVDSDVSTSYKVYRKNPLYYPESLITTIGYEESGTPQYFDFTTSDPDPDHYSNYDAVNKQLLLCEAGRDSISGLKTTYIVASTAVRNDLGEYLYPKEYTLKIEWEKTYAYLTSLDVRDDVNINEKRLVGNFIMTLSNFEAVSAPGAAAVTIHGAVRTLGSRYSAPPYTSGGSISVWAEEWTAAASGTKVGDLPVAFDSDPASRNFSISYPSFGGKDQIVVKIRVEDPSLNDAETNNGRWEYWLVIRRGEVPTYLTNIKVEGNAPISSGSSIYAWKTLYWFNSDSNTTVTDPLLVLKSPAAFNPAPAANADTNYTMEIDGVVTELKFTGWPEAGGSVTYNQGDNNNWYGAPISFEFNGGTSSNIIASLPGRQDRFYSFTIIRAGAMSIELLTDMRDPESALYSGDPSTVYTDKQIVANNTERGGFQAQVGSKTGVNNALPGQDVTLRVTPKLGWVPSSLQVLKADGTFGPISGLEEPSVPLSPSRGPQADPDNPAVTLWRFKMPDANVRLVLKYDFAAVKLPGVAYVAPETRAAYAAPYGDPVKLANGASAAGTVGSNWAYATSDLQGVINKFDGGSFTEVWILEGTYYLDRNNVLDKAASWADEITDRSDERNRAFVLKQGVKLYGGFKGTEGGTNLEIARALRFPDPSIAAQENAARRTILSGLIDSDNNKTRDANVRHVVIASGITPPSGDSNPAVRQDLGSASNYDFNPFDDSKPSYFKTTFTTTGITYLDTLNITGGIRTPDISSITVNNNAVVNAYGAGLYCVNASPYLRNVRIGDNTAARGGGMYSVTNGAGTSAPVLYRVTFNNNGVTGYGNTGGDGGGFASQQNGGLSLPTLLTCTFRNNTSVGGGGAGAYIMSGKALIRKNEFLHNTANSGSCITNTGDAWIFDSYFHDQKGSTGSAIQQSGTAHLVNVTLQNNDGGIVNVNNGTLAATNLWVNSSGGVSNNGNMSLVNTRLSNNGTGARLEGGVSLLTNVVIDNNTTGVDFGVWDGRKTEAGVIAAGAVLTNVTIHHNGAGLAASAYSTYNFNHPSANLLLNSVRLSGNGAGIRLTQNAGSRVVSTQLWRGLYVTLNNVTAAENTGPGLDTTSILEGGLGNIALTDASGIFDTLNLRARNSVFIGNNGVNEKNTEVSERQIIGAIGVSGTLAATGSNTLYVTPDREGAFAVGSTFKIADRYSQALKNTVCTVTAVNNTTPLKQIVFSSTTAETYSAGDLVVTSGYNSVLGRFTMGATGTIQTGPDKYLVVRTADEYNLFDSGMYFKTAAAGPTPGALGSSLNQVTGKEYYIPGQSKYLGEYDNLAAFNSWYSLANPGRPFEDGDWFINRAAPPPQRKREYSSALPGWTGSADPREYRVKYTASMNEGGSVAGKYIMLNGSRSGIGAMNKTGTLAPTGNTVRVTSAYQAGLLTVGTKFKIALGGPDGNLKPVECQVTAVSGTTITTITFSANAALSYNARDFMVPADPYMWINLAGDSGWSNSLVGLADGANSGALIPSAGKTLGTVLTSTYRPLGTLQNAGNNSAYPASVSDLVNQCFEVYDGKNSGATAALRSVMTTLFTDYLYTWAGTPESGYLEKRTIPYLLGKDNGFNKGDQRTGGTWPVPSPWTDGPSNNRKNETIDVGAYEN